MRSKTYYEPVYKIWTTVFIEPDQDKARKYAEKLIKETLDLDWSSQAKTIEYCPESGGQRIVTWLRKPEAPLLAHELIHVIEYGFEKRGIQFSLSATENIAYYMEHLFGVFEPLLKAKQPKPTKE